MSNDLFRPEVLDAKRNSWLGRISLAQPMALWILGLVAGLAALAIILFLALGSYTRRSSVVGQLVPDLGLSAIVAPNNGVVARLFPQEGQTVQEGDPLALIQVPRNTVAGEDSLTVVREGLSDRKSSISALAQSQDQQLQAQISGAQQQLENARRELSQIETEISTRREQVRIGRETVERYEKVADEKYVSAVQVNQQRQSLLETLNAQQGLERQATGIRRNIAQLEQSLRELPAQRLGIHASSRRDLATLEQERVQTEANGELLLKAPTSGLIASRLLEPGQAVQAGQAVMNVLPKGSSLQAQLMVPSSAIGFIEPGDRVLLRYQAYPYQKFGHQSGKVIRIARNTVNTTDAQGQNSQPVYRVLVALDRQTITAYGKQEALRPGMVVDADILGEKRKLYEWIFEPLYSLRGKMAQ